ncbi:spore germination protein GerPC [Sediminibacillus massiliensis]|uniref:spore germination protein GerPC n=1 Tax=Sediminibacillus massiliensis TaxID=1926277 RepID=UPI0009883538|nr:spore germination protein GerPC [Sediminibacillus massiliensis]
MHPHSWTQYISELHHYIQQQDKKLKELEKRIEDLEKNNQNNHTTVERIDYHFDQLKIERLDGTLHIGLSPEGLSSIEDMDVNQALSPMREQKQDGTKQLIDEMNGYLTKEGANLLNHLSNQYNRPLNQQEQDMLLDDIRKQLPARVRHYLQNHHSTGSNTEKHDQIMEQIKAEIFHSLHQYFQKN